MKKTYFALFVLLVACTDSNNGLNSSAGDASADAVKQIRYLEDQTDFPNPDRGFYGYTVTSASSYSILDATSLRSKRDTLHKEGKFSQYEVYNTVFFRYFILDNFVSSTISSTFLSNMQQDFDNARLAGVKLIPRFVYTVTPKKGTCPVKNYCPPYGDANKAQMIAHLEQLKDVINSNKDVITSIQMGLIGIWGEGYYTDHFGDQSSNTPQTKLLDENWNDRSEILKALLDKIDSDIMIQVRVPQSKQRYIYGVNSPVTSAALTDNEAYSGNHKSRIGFHNDCLFSGVNDAGTYTDYGNSSTNANSGATVRNALKQYLQDDSQFVIVGGETCSDKDYNPQNNCAAVGGLADTDLRKMHFTYLNAAYNSDVNNDWIEGGCMDDIKKNLGYRFFLQSATLTNTVSSDGVFNYTLNMRNRGYAAPVLKRNVYLIFEKTDGSQTHKHLINTDVRRWFTSETIEGQLTLPASLTKGKYNVYLHIADKNPSIANRADYSIRLANQQAWQPTTGYNDLNHTVTVQ